MYDFVDGVCVTQGSDLAQMIIVVGERCGGVFKWFEEQSWLAFDSASNCTWHVIDQLFIGFYSRLVLTRVNYLQHVRGTASLLQSTCRDANGVLFKF